MDVAHRGSARAELLAGQLLVPYAVPSPTAGCWRVMRDILDGTGWKMRRGIDDGGPQHVAIHRQDFRSTFALGPDSIVLPHQRPDKLLV